jgi:NAD(P)-dependent dehydrogenase (short-subunit alcohol dehydrogenase family)
MFRTVQAEFGQLDIFVSNARPEAGAFFQPPMDITLEQWDTAMDSQAKAFLHGVRQAVPLMRTGGSILAITYAQGSRTGGLQPLNTLPPQAQDLIRTWHTRGWTPMGRLGTPADIGNVVALFCSDQAGWITGQVIYADGGASLMNPEVPPEIQLG